MSLLYPSPKETPRHRRFRRRYTRVVKIGKKWNTYLQIDHQGFSVVEQTSRARAKWYAHMLALALERLIEQRAKLKSGK